jgi:predicted transcriptional regulator
MNEKPKLSEKAQYSKDLAATLSDEQIELINWLIEKEPSCYADIADLMLKYRNDLFEEIYDLFDFGDEFYSKWDIIRKLQSLRK